MKKYKLHLAVICVSVVVCFLVGVKSYASETEAQNALASACSSKIFSFDPDSIEGDYVLPAVMSLYTSGASIYDLGVIQGDINNDGIGDFVQSYEGKDGNESCFVKRVWVSNGQGKWVEDANYNIPLSFNHQGCANVWIPDNKGVTLMDINNDGYSDIYSYFDDGNDRTGNLRSRIYLNKKDGTGWEYNDFYSRNFPTPLNAPSCNSVEPHLIAKTIDVNGDGFFDLVKSYSNTLSGAGYRVDIEIFLNKGDGTWQKYEYYSFITN